MSKTRKLAGIVFVDIVSYTSMMSKDEQATIHLLEKLRKVLYPLAEDHHGVVLKELGDGALIRFDSVLEATRYGVELQQSITSIENLKLRIGIHLGDVLVDKKDVFGSGVNVAARIPPLAAPGGVVITEDVWKQIMNRPEFTFVPLGPKRLKGLSLTTRTFALAGEGLVVPGIMQRMVSHRAFKGALFSVVATAASMLWYIGVPNVPQLATTEVPSIAILSLTNSGPGTDEFLSHSLTQDLITDVRGAGLIRVAQMSDVASLQKANVPIEQIARRLNIQYILEGSIKRESDAVRLNGQIFEASTGRIVWAERMRTNAADVASLQAKVVGAILNSLNITNSSPAVQEYVKRRINPDAYESYLRGKYFFDRNRAEDDIAVARGLFEQAVSLDSGFVGARIGLGQTYEGQGEYANALQAYETGLSIAQATGDKPGEAKCFSSMARMFLQTGNIPAAQECSGQALGIFSEIGDKNSERMELKMLGDIGLAEGDYAKGYDNYMKCLALQQRLGDRRGQGATFGDIGILSSAAGDYATALDYYQRSLAIARESADSAAEAFLTGKIGDCYALVGEYEKAAEYLGQSASISRALQDVAAENTIRDSRSMVYFYAGDYAPSLELLEQSLNGVKEEGGRSGEPALLEKMGKVHLARGNMDRAVKLLNNSVNLFDQSADQNSRIRALSWLTLAEAKSRKQGAAREHLRQIEERFDTTDRRIDFVETCWNLAQTYDLLKNDEGKAAFLAVAYHEILARARKISDEEIRQSFLTKATPNREIVAAWGEASPADSAVGGTPSQ